MSSRYMSAALELGIPIEVFLLGTGEAIGSEGFEGLGLNKDSEGFGMGRDIVLQTLYHWRRKLRKLVTSGSRGICQV